MKKKILFVGNSTAECRAAQTAWDSQYEVLTTSNAVNALKSMQNGGMPDAVVSELELSGLNGRQLLQAVRSEGNVNRLPFFFISDQLPNDKVKKLLQEGADDIFFKPVNYSDISVRLDSLLSLKQKGAPLSDGISENVKPFKMPFVKRLFDILISGGALLALSPVFLAVAVAMKLTSKGPIFYLSNRVGSGYKIFKLYKFRTMQVDADKKLDDMKNLNAYKAPSKTDGELFNQKCPECQRLQRPCSPMLYRDGEMICENFYRKIQESEDGGIFMKVKSDPRVTKLGKFLRNTSIDELPQLINIFKGDMSLVGNRPLPLYEAEKLTTDAWTLRFLAPAGLTGLWQVTKRGKGEMSTQERIDLDNDYARNYSFKNDIKIILKTFPALFQEENV